MKYHKVCSCGASYSREQWDALVEVGIQRYDWGEVQRLKNCTTCKTTLAEILDPGEQQDPAVGDIWKAKEGALRVKITDTSGKGVSYRAVRGKARGFMSNAGFFETFTPVRRGT